MRVLVACEFSGWEKLCLSAPDVSVCSCHCHGPSAENEEHFVTEGAKRLVHYYQLGRKRGIDDAAKVAETFANVHNDAQAESK